MLDDATKSAVCLGTTSGELELSGGTNKCMKQFKFWNVLKKVWNRAEAEEAKAINNTKHVTKHAIWLTKSEAEEEAVTTVSRYGDGEERMERRGSNMWRMMSENVARLALIHKTEMHPEPMFSDA